jgi:hypothetical protein
VLWENNHEASTELQRVRCRCEPVSCSAAMIMLLLAGFLMNAADVGARPSAPAGDSIKLRARTRVGAWRTEMSLRLVKTNLISFSVCAVWDASATRRFICAVPNGVRLPDGTVMRLEQHPVKRALKRADSPGWGLLATSTDPSLRAILSNTVTGDRTGRFHYRVTLRDSTGRVLRRSNILTVVWHR